MAWIAIGLAAFFLFQSEQQTATLQADQRAFDLRARDTIDRLAELRVAQQAYVAEGQGVALWMPKVEQTAGEIDSAIAALRKSAITAAAQSAVDEAAGSLAEFVRVDKRARDYLSSDQQLMAGDVIFTEGGQAAVAAAQQVELARRAEQEALEAAERTVRAQEKMALAGAGGLAALIVLMLGMTRVSETHAEQPASGATTAPELPVTRTALSASPAPPSPAPPLPSQSNEPPSDRAFPPALRAAAELCTDFGCARDVADVQALLARAGNAMNAAGLVVWLGSTTGADLRPVLTHGYSDEVRTRLPDVPRSANNAAAAAYRSGEAQLVLPQTQGSQRSTGALVAPLLSADGCIGALSIEIPGGEASESLQALAAIVASQLAGVLASAALVEQPSVRAAASS